VADWFIGYLQETKYKEIRRGRHVRADMQLDWDGAVESSHMGVCVCVCGGVKDLTIRRARYSSV
jgi:hypothetical protein